jgi:Ohr subfamily peroxiredoxin
MSIERVLYQAKAEVIGGRDGQATIPEANLTLKITTPKALGGPGGEGTNPEQLFAAGYSACFLSALKLVASKKKVAIPADASVTGTVGIGVLGAGFGLEAALTISLPGVDPAVAQDLVNTAHSVCPYSNATRGNIDVSLTLV